MGPIAGADELLAKLQTLGDKFEVRIMRGATGAGAKVFRNAARRAAETLNISPYAVNRLRDAIRHRRSRGKPGLVVAGIFIASIPSGKRKSDDPAAWWRWFEEGTEPRYRGSRTVAAKAARKLGLDRKGFTGRILGQRWLSPVLEGS